MSIEPVNVPAVVDTECVSFLQWALPRLRLSWAGFRKVRRQVCKRIERRRRALELPDLDAYRVYLEAHPAEWRVLDGLCHVTISRFSRDRAVFEFLAREVLPALARAAAESRRPFRAWSAGCASGEEPYTLVLVWEALFVTRFPDVRLEILATDVDGAMLARARAARYGPSSLRELPEEWRRLGFEARQGAYHLRAELRRAVTLREHDLRTGSPDGPFDLVLCRNLAFTYFDAELQLEACSTLGGALRPGGALVVGAHEALPPGAHGFLPWPAGRGIYRRHASCGEEAAREPGP
ncbi:MAG TPA: protein-glutamate O-methyltransferase CheR [Gaiellaceae bacterium]|nr:protein-glutamate O-methyltransferase CheR [Gaiellaceae bacterium]